MSPPYDSESDDRRMRPRMSRASVPAARPRKSRAELRAVEPPEDVFAPSAPPPRKSRSDVPVFNDSRVRARVNANRQMPLASLEDAAPSDDEEEKTIVGNSMFDGDNGATQQICQFKLKVIEGADIGRSVSITPEGLLIGRGDACGLQLQDGAASRRHAQISIQNGQLTIVDLKTSNGTKINDVAIDANREERLQNGDRITIGLTVLEVEDLYVGLASAGDSDTLLLGNQPAPPPPPPAAKARRRNSRAMVPVPPPPPLMNPADDERDTTNSDALPDELVEQHRRSGGNRSAGTVLGDRIRNMSKKTRITIIAIIALILLGSWSKSLISEHMAARREEKRLMALKAENDLKDQFDLIKKDVGAAIRNKNPSLALQKIEEASQLAPSKMRELDRLRSTAQKDLAAETVFKRAKSLYTAGNYNEALSALREVDEDSSFSELVPELKKNIERDALEKTKKDIQALLDERDIEGARAKIAELPSDIQSVYLDMLSDTAKIAKIEAREAAQMAAVSAQNKKRAAQNKRIAEINSAIDPVVQKFDKSDLRGAKKALDAISTKGKPAHVVQKINQLKKAMPNLQREFSSGRELFEKGRREQAAEPLLKALKIWNSLGITSTFGTKLSKHTAECLEKKGKNALDRKDYVTAGKSFKEVLRIDKNSSVARNGMASILGKAKEIYMQGYTEKNSNPMRARQLFEQVVAMTPSDSDEHKKAKDWLEKLMTKSF